MSGEDLEIFAFYKIYVLLYPCVRIFAELSILYDTKSVLPIRCYPLRFAFENKNAILETHDEQSMKWLT